MSDARTVVAKTDRRVLDSHAVLALLEDEPGADRVAHTLDHGEPWMTLINLGEVAYIIERERGAIAADTVWENFLAHERPAGRPIQYLALDRDLVRRAATLKARGGISYADCFVAAAAQRLHCPVLTGDPEFQVAEKAGIEVDWID